MNAFPAAYLRRSYVDAESPGDISLEAQRASVRKLAHADGHNGDLKEYNDWGVSADVAKAAKRTEYTRLLADMEAGRVTAVYAFDVDRLYRDPRDLLRLQDAALRHNVRIVTTGGPLPIGDGDDPVAEGFAFMGAVFGRMELRKSQKRARAAREVRRARGDRFGHPRFGYRHARDEAGKVVEVPDDEQQKQLATALNAHHAAGSVLGAVRLLNEFGVPPPKGGDRWWTSVLTRIIEANAPELLPRRTIAGKRLPVSTTLAQLVRCHCGQTMTPNRVRAQLYCHRGHVEGTSVHGRYTVREQDVLPFVVAEMERLRTPERIDLETDNAERREALEGRRRRIVENYEDGLTDKAERDAKLARVREDLAALDEREEVVSLPAIAWDGPVPELNDALRAVLKWVQLGEDMRPVSAEWRVPEWRA